MAFNAKAQKKQGSRGETPRARRTRRGWPGRRRKRKAKRRWAEPTLRELAGARQDPHVIAFPGGSLGTRSMFSRAGRETRGQASGGWLGKELHRRSDAECRAKIGRAHV